MMPNARVTIATTKLKQYFNTLSWFGRLFFPGQLAKTLRDNAPPEVVYPAANNSTWFFHRWFFSGLRAFFQSEVDYFQSEVKNMRPVAQGFEGNHSSYEQMASSMSAPNDRLRRRCRYGAPFVHATDSAAPRNRTRYEAPFVHATDSAAPRNRTRSGAFDWTVGRGFGE